VTFLKNENRAYLSRPFMTPSEHEVHVNVDATVVPVHEAVPEEEETGQQRKIQKD
tara:strand:+ start:766 stop:930 length:165 start_codon:yes stop_codon:yes gene_type:complete